MHFRRMPMVLAGVQGMPVRYFRMMRGFFVISGLVMFGGLAMMLRGVLVMLRGLFMMLMNIVLTVHLGLPLGPR
jgi:hypothetical protein